MEHQSFTQCQQMFMRTEVKNSKETVASANSMTGTSICTWYGATKNANNQGESTLHSSGETYRSIDEQFMEHFRSVLVFDSSSRLF